MSRKNYFELLDLEFDPPATNQRLIEKKIAEWKQRIEDILANESSDAKRATLKSELALHDDMVEVLKNPKTRNLEAKTMKEQRVNQLEKLVDLMSYGVQGTLTVTRVQIRNVQQRMRLSQETVEGVYKAKSFDIQKTNVATNLKDSFMIAALFANISQEIDKLHSLSIPGYAWTDKVRDLYDLACLFTGGEESAADAFHKKRTTDLFGIMESLAAQYASDMSDQGHVLGNLFTAGSTQVFNSEENRKKYDNTIQREGLKEFFALLKSAPESFKKDRYFAEVCIRTIQKHFSDYGLALAIYNQEAGLAQDPYEPIEALIHVSCPSCKTPSEFRTIQDAENSACPVCGTKLFVECPRCHKKTPAVAERCSCGFQISEMQFFDDYLKAANFALQEMNLSEAAKQLENAKNAFPGNPKILPVENALKKVSEVWKKKLEELNAMISARRFVAADQLLGQILTAQPQMKLQKEEQLIQKKLAEAKRLMPGDSFSQNEKANRCVDVLQVVSDYAPAVDVLNSCKPRKPLNLHASVRDGAHLSCTLCWDASGDKGVSYTVVRKKNGMPKNSADGDLIASGITTLTCVDKTLQPGISYGYSVFSHRQAAFSEPLSVEVAKYSELDEHSINVYAESGVCHFSWVLPLNCIGVRILRSVDSIPPISPGPGSSIVAAKASANYNDTSVINGRTYGYRLQCAYPYENGYRYSEGVTVTARPEPLPEKLQNINVRIEGVHVTVTWTPLKTGGSVILSEAAHAANSLVGQTIPLSDINAVVGGKRNYANTAAINGTASFDVPPNLTSNIAVISVLGSKGVISAIRQVSSVEKCEIDRRQTQLLGGNRLAIRLQNIPKNLTNIHYVVARKVSDKAPWATMETARQRLMSAVSVDDYRRDGMILVERLPQDDLYVSVIGEYHLPSGNTLFSETAKMRISNRPKGKLRYSFRWSGGGKFIGRSRTKHCTLTVTSDRPETPEIFVLYKSDGHIPMSLQDPKRIILHTIPEMQDGFPNNKYEYEFPDDTWTGIPSGTVLRLYIGNDSMLEYEIAPSDLDSCKVP